MLAEEWSSQRETLRREQFCVFIEKSKQATVAETQGEREKTNKQTKNYKQTHKCRAE